MSVFGFPFGTPFGSDVSVTPIVPPVIESLTSSLVPVQQNFGQDILVFNDVDSSFSPVSDGRVLGEALGKRFTTRRGTMPFHDDFGMDVRDWLNEAMTQDQLFRLKAAMEAEAVKDERVLGADIRLAFDSKQSSLTAKVEAQTSTGPYKLTLRVTDLTTELIQGG